MLRSRTLSYFEENGPYPRAANSFGAWACPTTEHKNVLSFLFFLLFPSSEVFCLNLRRKWVKAAHPETVWPGGLCRHIVFVWWTLYIGFGAVAMTLFLLFQPYREPFIASLSMHGPFLFFFLRLALHMVDFSMYIVNQLSAITSSFPQYEESAMCRPPQSALCPLVVPPPHTFPISDVDFARFFQLRIKV